MPYRIDLKRLRHDVGDRLIDLGAIEVEATDSQMAALMPDAVGVEDVMRALDGADLRVTPAIGRDHNSVWILRPRAVTVAGISIVPAGDAASGVALQLIDSPAFGTGLHPTTALCLEAIRDAVDELHPDCLLDVGTGSGVLALAALRMGVPRATGVDVDAAAVAAAADNARLNELSQRFDLVHGGPEAVAGTWPLVLANIQTAPLIEGASSLVWRVARGGRLVLSGMPEALTWEVERTYVRLGMRTGRIAARSGWAAIALHPTW